MDDDMELRQELQRRTRQAYKRVFASDDGKLVLSDLSKFACINRPTFVPGDPFETHINEGMRRVPLRIFSFINMSDGEMMRLAHRRIERDEEAYDEDD